MNSSSKNPILPSEKLTEKNPTLNIAIPTYNRKEACLKTVNNFIKQVVDNDLQDKVVITVSDNCSPDLTYEELMKLKNKYPKFIEVTRQKTNIGFLGNFQYLLDNCTSEYIWFCGDDDIYDKAAIPIILSIIEKHNPIYSFINCFFEQNKLGVKVNEDFVGTVKEVFDIVKQVPTFISTNLIKVDEIRKYSSTSKYWPFYELLCQINSEKKAYLCAKPLVINAKADKKSDWQADIDKSLLYINELLSFYIKEKDNPILKDSRQFLIEFYVKMCADVLGINFNSADIFKTKYYKYKKLFNIFLILSIVLFLILLILIIYNFQSFF